MEDYQNVKLLNDNYLIVKARAGRMKIPIEDALASFIKENVKGRPRKSECVQKPIGLWDIFKAYADLDSRKQLLFNNASVQIMENHGDKDNLIERFKIKWLKL